MSSRALGSEATDDRTTKARIRDAAIECIAASGVHDTTVRMIAAAADVSPGLVIHHFGSMEDLRSACDAHVAAAIRAMKSEVMSARPGLDVLGALRDSEVGWMVKYLSQVLADDTPAVAKLIDDLVADAEGYLEQGVEAGILRPTADPRGRAVVLAVWSLGALVLHRHLERLLGVDITSPDVGRDPAVAVYGVTVYEMLGRGLFTEAFAEHVIETFARVATGAEPTSPDPPPEPARDDSPPSKGMT